MDIYYYSGYDSIVIAIVAILVLSLIVTPVYGQLLSTQRLKLNICAYAEHPVTQFVVKAKYKGESLQKTLNFQGSKNCSYAGQKGMWVTMLFGPKERGILDFYNVCITNLSTNERHCETHHWFPGYSYSTKYIEIFANR